MKNKFIAILSTTAISTLLASITASSVYAFDGDIYEIKEGKATLKHSYKDAATNGKVKRDILRNREKYGYEYNGKIYNYMDVNKSFLENGKKRDEALKAIDKTDKELGKVEDIVIDNKVEVKEVSAINETAVQVTGLAKEVKEDDLTGMKITLKAGDVSITATYVSKSLTKDGKANFVLDDSKKLTDAVTYTVSSDWAKFTTNTFVAKVVAPYVSKFEKVTTGITANTDTDSSNRIITFEAKNQYGEQIAMPETNSVTPKVTVNGMPLTVANDNEVSYDNGKVTIKKLLNENDEVAITLTHKVEDKVLAEDTFNFVVGKAETQKVSKLIVNAEKTSLPAKEETNLKVTVLDQFNNEMSKDGVRFVVNGKVVNPDDSSDLIQLNNGKYTFKTSTPGEYKVEVFSLINSKVKGEVTITVGAATLTGLTVKTDVKDVTTIPEKYFNKEELIIAEIDPNQGAALLPANIKFNITTTTTDLKAEDVKVVAENKTVGKGDDAKEIIVIKAITSKAGTFAITPYVGESFIDEKVIKGDTLTFTTTINKEVASISDFTFDAKELKVGAENVKAEIVFKNKHGEVLKATDVKPTIISSKEEFTGKVTVVQGEEENKDKTYLNLSKLEKGKSLVTVQVGEIIKSTTVAVTEATLTTIDAGKDITGVVAGDEPSKAKYQEIKFLDQDGKSIIFKDADVTVRKEGATEDLKEVGNLVTLGEATKNEKGEITGINNSGSKIDAIKVNPNDDIEKGTYTVTISHKVGDGDTAVTVKDSFTVTVGAARTLTNVTAESKVTTMTVGGETTVLVVPTDQYNKVVTLDNPKTDIKLTTNEMISAGNFTEKKNDDDELVGYEATLTGDAKGTVVAEFVVKVTEGDKSVEKKCTKTYTVDAVGNLANTVEITNPGLLKASELTDKQLVATVKDVNGNVINASKEDLKWTQKDVAIKGKDGKVVTDLNEATKVKLSEDGKLTVAINENDKGKVASITLTAIAQTANLKSDSITLEISTEESKLVGELQAVSSIEDKVLDADKDQKGIQISLDGDDKDGESADGTITFTLQGNDQYGNENVKIDAENAVLSTSDGTIAIIEKSEKAVKITPVSVGTTQVHIQYQGQSLSIDVNVTEKNAVIIKAKEAKKVAEATKSVEAAEAAKTDATRKTAQELVTALKEGKEKEDLKERLDKIVTTEDTEKAEAKKVAEATKSVEAAEAAKTDATRKTAQELVTALKEGKEKEDLKEKLNKIVTVEDTAKAKELEAAKKEFDDLKATIILPKEIKATGELTIGKDKAAVKYVIVVDGTKMDTVEKDKAYATVTQVEAIKTAVEAKASAETVEEYSKLTNTLKNEINKLKDQKGTKETTTEKENEKEEELDNTATGETTTNK